jgi:hypothetical protein
MGLANGRKSESGNVKLHYSDLEICQIYAEALESETGMPIEKLERVFDYDNYIITYDSAEDKMIIKICGVYVQFEMQDQDVYVVNYGCGSGWQLCYSFAI